MVVLVGKVTCGSGSEWMHGVRWMDECNGRKSLERCD